VWLGYPLLLAPFRTYVPFLFFYLDDVAVPPPSGGKKAIDTRDPASEECTICSDDIVPHGEGVVDVALSSRRGGAIEREDLCGVLSNCLHDVSFALMTLLGIYFAVWFLF
jgi:hypothetical protein